MSASDETPQTAPPRRRSLAQRLLLALLFLLTATVVAVVGKSMLHLGETAAVQDIPTHQTDVLSGKQKLHALNERVDALSTRVSKLEMQPATLPTATATPQTSAVPANPSRDAEVTRLKSDMQALTNTVAALQEQLKQTNNATDSGQKQVLAALVNSLSAVAQSGKSFKNELTFLRQAAAQNQALGESLALLEPVAATGAPNIETLREKWAGLARHVEAALRKAEATTWQDRLIAEVQSLVIIRPLHPQADDLNVSTSIGEDLAHAKLDAALTKVSALPEAAQNLIKDWREQAEARQKLDAALAQINRHLMEQDSH